ncbi:MAG TPA: hypothetical protein VK348_00940, partial [Planctomycetota bacterium]|nr:hypothetical protein [Planctomycetota bacterium]
AEGEGRLQELQRQQHRMAETALAQEHLIQELANQSTASTIAQNRHASRLHVLESALHEQEKRTGGAQVRANERGKIEQLAHRADDQIAILRTRLIDVTQRLESLQPIRVELWR